jgi:hypothetical protein
MAERIEAFHENRLDECARLLLAAFNAVPWNEL